MDEPQTPAERRAAMTWAQRLKRVFNIDIETCSECAGAVKVIACVDDPVVIRKILDHLRGKAGRSETTPLPESRAPPVGLFNWHPKPTVRCKKLRRGQGLPAGQGGAATGEKTGSLLADRFGIQGELKGVGRRKGGPLTANYRWTWAKRVFILPILNGTHAADQVMLLEEVLVLVTGKINVQISITIPTMVFFMVLTHMATGKPAPIFDFSGLFTIEWE